MGRPDKDHPVIAPIKVALLAHNGPQKIVVVSKQRIARQLDPLGARYRFWLAIYSSTPHVQPAIAHLKARNEKILTHCQAEMRTQRAILVSNVPKMAAEPRNVGNLVQS